MIKINNVCKKFSNNLIALDNVNFKINDGKILGIVGTNGSGKSTLLNIISGIMEADSGSIEIDNELIFDNEDKKEELIYVSDDQFYIKNFNLIEVKKFYKMLYKNFNENKFDELVKMLNFDEKINIKSFSKGMKKQASIIIALSSNAKYILLDEIFDGLDIYIKNKIKKIFIDEVEKNKLTLIVSSHNLKEVEEICDDLIMLDKGKVLFSKDISEIKDNIYKYQIVSKNIRYNDIKEIFSEYKIFSITAFGSVYTIILEGDEKGIIERIENINPLLYEKLEVSLEEIFISKLEAENV